jgi:acetylornithine deacetylase/succinyl-diaminopimelate desuccinylase-like protein
LAAGGLGSVVGGQSKKENIIMEALLIKRVIDLAIQIQQIPAPTFHEGRRADFIHEQFQAEGLLDVSRDPVGNVYARLPGRESGPASGCRPLVISAHLDTVFPTSTDLRLERSTDKISGPGIGDNSLGVAGLFGLLWALRARDITLPGDLWLAANVGEEGLGNLRGIRAVVDRFGDRALAYLVLEGMALGQVYHRGLGVQRYCISVHTPGGHSWVDYGRPSAIHILAGLVTRLAALPLPAQPRTTLNVGIISGGTSVNTISAHAHLELDLRSEGVHELAALVAQVETLVREAQRPQVQVTAEIIGQRPTGEINPGHPLVQLAVRALEAQGIKPRMNAGSTDANLPLSLGLPVICLGLTTGCGAHTVKETIHLPPLAQGLEQVVWVVERAHRELEVEKR